MSGNKIELCARSQSVTTNLLAVYILTSIKYQSLLWAENKTLPRPHSQVSHSLWHASSVSRIRYGCTETNHFPVCIAGGYQR